MKRKGKTRVSDSRAHGILLLDKPVGPSSRTVLDRVEARFALGGIGHSGTLDPLASGLLLVLLGRARRLQDLFMGRPKTYIANFTFGQTSETLDGEGPIHDSPQPVPSDLAKALEAVLPEFLGSLQQAPPEHSALRIRGRRAYQLAREGKALELLPREIQIDAIRILDVEPRSVRLEIRCGSGTYIRSLARDIGNRLNCGAWLSQLRRTESSGFSVEGAIDPELATPSDVLSMATALAGFLRIDVSEEEAVELMHGRMRSLVPPLGFKDGDPLFAWSGGVPVCRLKRAPSGEFHTCLLLVPELPPLLP
jgi:tRNA pseudouridine55 synthase